MDDSNAAEGSALWFTRFFQSGEGWLPLAALASSAYVFAAVCDTEVNVAVQAQPAQRVAGCEAPAARSESNSACVSEAVLAAR